MSYRSQYTCFSLAVMTLSSPNVFPLLHEVVQKAPISFPQLTELRRPEPYSPMEKNWVLFFSPTQGSFVQYDLVPGKRTFGKLIGNGYVTKNMTDKLEEACVENPFPIDMDPYDWKAAGDPTLKFKDGWHQATNSLRLIMCKRNDSKCHFRSQKEVFISLIQRKRHNRFGFVARYERVAILWEGNAPFRVIAIGKHYIRFNGEEWGALGFTREGISDVSAMPSSTPTSKSTGPQKRETITSSAVVQFFFPLSLAWDHPRRIKKQKRASEEAKPEDMYVGYLDDFVMIGLGIGDLEMGVVRVGVSELLQGVTVCTAFI